MKPISAIVLVLLVLATLGVAQDTADKNEAAERLPRLGCASLTPAITRRAGWKPRRCSRPTSPRRSGNSKSKPPAARWEHLSPES